MTDTNIKRLNYYVEKVNDKLEEYKMQYTSDSNLKQRIIVDAMWYSLNAGGKRLRPALVLEFNRICGGNEECAISTACAIEMIHTFSLIHDDIPCMDNDDFRRGLPSCHKKFGENIALLAGDALLNFAFEIISKDSLLDDKTKVSIISCISKYVGVRGMIGGQIIDVDKAEKTKDEILKLYSLKTSALLSASCIAGCIIADKIDKISYAVDYSYNLGIAFQIIDDILDIVGNINDLGKPVKSDILNDKETYVTAVGIEEAKKSAEYYTKKSLESLYYFDDNDFLTQLTKMLLQRKK